MSAWRHPGRRGFTLTELLITIAIILILIAIALPNLLESRTRARTARAVSELRSIAHALERYFLDFRFYPLRTTPNGQSWPSGLNNLTTPVEYIKPARLPDPFSDGRFNTHYHYWPIRLSGFIQNNTNPSNKDSNWYLLSSNGPDHRFDAFAETLRGNGLFIDRVYSPTNGSNSPGNIWRLGGTPDGVAKPFVVPFLGPSAKN